MFFKLVLFFAFFNSFAAFNFESFNWGLLWSWIFSFIFSVIYFFKAIYFFINKICDNKNIIILKIFIIIFSISLFSWFLQWIGILVIPPYFDISIARSYGHVGYILFYFIVYVCAYYYLSKNREKYFIYYRYFFIYPFIFISLWGIYQNLSTYNFFDYYDIFNNSISTGFTYERFREDHRVSSIFPEPSEYSYYLALMTPIIWAYFRNIPFKSFYIIRYVTIFLLISQVLMIKSLSYFVALPIIIFVILRYIEKLKGFKFFGAISLIGIIGIALVGLTMASRLGSVSSGGDGSIDDRLLGIYESIDLFAASPFIGFGYGITRGIDQLFFLLASLGLIGTLLIFRLFYVFLLKNNIPLFLFGATLAMFVSCLTSNNIFGYLFFWIYLALLAAYPVYNRI